MPTGCQKDRKTVWQIAGQLKSPLLFFINFKLIATYLTRGLFEVGCKVLNYDHQDELQQSQFDLKKTMKKRCKNV